LHDYQFFPGQLKALVDREVLAHQRSLAYQIPEQPDEDAERKAERLAEQSAIDAAEPLTEKETQLKERLVDEGFPAWTRRDYHALLRALERHGRAPDSVIAAEMTGFKEPDEVSAYLAVFWQRYPELADAEKIANIIERSEARLQRIDQVRELIRRKCQKHRSTPLTIPYFNGKGKEYVDDEDTFILRALNRLGYGPDDVFDQIHHEIIREPIFRFNWFIKTRTPMELSRRAHKLIGFLEKEDEKGGGASSYAELDSAVPAKRSKGRR
jgi:SWI/SNF-related matrix-associated actin-dependent regulator of chromatin subfamily A member 5